jgi:hypothetical protein
VIDDDEELARATERGLAAMAAAAEVEAFPELGGNGYQGPGAGWRPKLAKDELRPPSASGAAAFNTKGLGTVLHVSWAHVAKPKKVQTKHLAQLLYPYACAVKWLDSLYMYTQSPMRACMHARKTAASNGGSVRSAARDRGPGWWL